MPERALIVGICTFRRQSIVDTVRSIFTQTRRPDAIIIIDNDETPTAEPLIAELGEESDIPLLYRHVRGGNIAIARNAVLEEADSSLLAFIDDDEIASPIWLAELESGLTEHRAAVFGPQIALYHPDDPAWMQVLSPHSFHGHLIGGALQAGSTGNCLIDLSHPAMKGRLFDERTAPKGGSDTQFFVEAYRDGARYDFMPKAVVSEKVPAHRASWGWLLRRRYRYGHTHARISGKKGPGDALVALAKTTYCGLFALIRTFDPVGGRASILRGTLHAGVFAACIGLPGPHEYDPAQKG